jgi:membrane associated rhomboid family serine protease
VSTKTPTPSADDGSSLLTVRSALILLLAVLAGGLIAGLMVVAGHTAAEAALAGLAAFAGTLVASNKIIR